MPHPRTKPVLRGAGFVAGTLLVAACTAAGPGPAGPDAATPAATPPPAPPAACLLDTDALATTTGLTWSPDATTADDTRCVYDPAGAQDVDFVAVDVAPVGGAGPAELDTVAAVCDGGSRAPAAGGRGFVCRLQGGSVFAALVRDGQLVTVAASAVPPGTTAERLAQAFAEQLAGLAG